RGTHDAVGPAQLTNRLITLDIIDEILDVDLHGWTPVRARGMGCRQYTPSSNATTLEPKKSGPRNPRRATRFCNQTADGASGTRGPGGRAGMRFAPRSRDAPGGSRGRGPGVGGGPGG